MDADIIIIGAGPAGLFAAVQASQGNKNIIILEKNSQAGKKLLITGSGQCNLTHTGEVRDFLDHYGDNTDKNFLRSLLYSFSSRDLLEFFRRRGISFTCTDEGKYFPASLKAEDILDVLLAECSKNDIQIKYDSPAEDIYFCEDKDQFNIKTPTKEYSSRYLIIAAGGKSYPTTGSTGDGYKFARKLGHNINKPKPVLTPLYIENYQFAEIAGVSLKGREISLWRKGSLVKRWTGDLLFTHQGISGPGVLNYSRYIEKGDTVKIKLLNYKNEAELDSLLVKKITSSGKQLFKNIIRDLNIPASLTEKLLEFADVNKNKKAAQINKKERKKTAKLLFSLPLKVKNLCNFNKAMLTGGGIPLAKINANTMESKMKSRLFFAGEIIDIDGDTGGYNLQIAFSSAYLAGNRLTEQN